jgi:AcrR family transcriptional regulator
MTTKDERRLMLLEAARDVILRFGYRKATLDDIAAEAGVSRATLYNYFPNKEELIRSIVAMEIERLSEALAASVDPADPADARLRALVQARYAHLRRIKALYQVVMGIARDVLPVAMGEIEAFQAAQIAGLAALLREGIDAGRFRQVDPDLFAQALLSALRGLDDAFMFENRESAADGASLLLDTLLDGLVLR